MPQTPKFRRRPTARPDEVLDAALDLFIERGFAMTRVEDIAERAGISKGAVYLYFPNKEALIEAIVKRALVPVAENVAALAKNLSGDPAEDIVRMIQLVGGRLGDQRTAAVPRLILSEAKLFPDLAAMYRREILDRGLAAGKTVLERGMQSGRFRRIDPDHAVRAVVGPLIANLILFQVFGIGSAEREAQESFLRSHVDILMNGLLREKDDE